jgi:hypothetical protein
MTVSPPARLQITGLLSTDLVAQVAAGESVIKCRYSWTCSITAMLVCIVGHVKWRWPLNDGTGLVAQWTPPRPPRVPGFTL